MSIKKLYLVGMLFFAVPVALAAPPGGISAEDLEVNIVNTPEVTISGTPEFMISGVPEVTLSSDSIFTIGGTTAVVVTEPAEVIVTETADVNLINNNRTQVQYLYFDDLGGGSDTVFTVSVGKKITITDFIVKHSTSNDGAQSGANFLRRNADGTIEDMFALSIEDNENEIVNLQTGFDFYPGDSLIFGTGGNVGTAQRVQGMAIGYMTDL